MKDVDDIIIEELKAVIEEKNNFNYRFSSETEEGMILNVIQINFISNDF